MRGVNGIGIDCCDAGVQRGIRSIHLRARDSQHLDWDNKWTGGRDKGFGSDRSCRGHKGDLAKELLRLTSIGR